MKLITSKINNATEYMGSRSKLGHDDQHNVDFELFKKLLDKLSTVIYLDLITYKNIIEVNLLTKLIELNERR